MITLQVEDNTRSILLLSVHHTGLKKSVTCLKVNVTIITFRIAYNMKYYNNICIIYS